MAQIALPVVEVLRDGSVESVHRGSIVVVDRTGQVLFFWGDMDFPTVIRSCGKPFQALPLLESGAADRFRFTDREIAITTGSISGQDFQQETIRGILEKIGLPESSLQCGTHRPFHVPTAKKLDAEGRRPGVLRNSCAGKHAGMLANCLFEHWPIETYTELGHPLQQAILEKISSLTEVPPEKIHTSVDGCGLPTFQVPLRKLAFSFARLADSSLPGVGRLMDCARGYPEMIAGEDRICTDLIRATQGRVFGKIGGEGVYGICFFEKEWGIALKIEDGSLRGVAPTVVEVLRRLGILSEDELAVLKRYRSPEVVNYRREVVGKIRPVLELKTPDRMRKEIRNS